MGTEITIAYVLYTSGLEYDDRVRKEILSIKKYIPNVDFTIFAITPDNKEECGVTDYGIKYRIPFLKSREKYKSGSNQIKKAYDFYKTINKQLKTFDLIICADEQTFIFPLLLNKRKKIIWDLHEIPSLFTRNYFTKKLFRYIEHKCNLIFHANKYRIDYLIKQGLINKPIKHLELRNFPDKQILPNKDDIFKRFKNWLDGRECIYIQGINNSQRKCFETLSAILKTLNYCAVIIGKINNEEIKKLEQFFDKEVINKRLFFCGIVPQKMTILYIRECIASLIFYSNETINNHLCEPNRMFQAITSGLPVIVGNNPPMKNIVEKYNFGISLDNDGSNISSIIDAFKNLTDNYEKYKYNIEKNKHKIMWEQQEYIFVDSINNLLIN